MTTRRNTAIKITIWIFAVLLLICPLFSVAHAAKPIKPELIYANVNLSIQNVILHPNSDTIQIASMIKNNDLSNTYISVVQSGTTNTSKIILTSNPIGKSVTVDIRIDNASAGFWGWSLPMISWNPAVMNLTGVQEGTCLTDKTGASALFIGNSPILWNNTIGEIEGGLAEALSSAGTSVDTSGVLATLTFKIINYGNSSITISGGYTIASYNQASLGLNPPAYIVCKNATIEVSPTDSPKLQFSLWATSTIVIIPVLGVIAYIWKKRTEKTTAPLKTA